ncbi:HAD family hydrolase [Treponema primitia]|uniref:HAD family hydrolase n=1 Tax=Treponema primitia TaxID=88058 RepID=UPI00025555B7|nr:HAD-IA family hydrolase [Treponema primitia]
MPEPRAVIFDLFFTLIDPMKEEYSRESEYAVLGMERSEFERRNGIDYDVRGSGKIRDPYEMVRHILRGLDLDEELLRRAADARLARIKRALYGVDKKNLELLEKIRQAGFKTCLISNADAADVYHWEGSPLSAAFDQVLFSYYEGLLKPDPRIFRLALDRLGIKAAQCFYVGDGGHEELRGAREAGITTILTTEYISHIWPERIPALRQNADYEVVRLEDILKEDMIKIEG